MTHDLISDMITRLRNASLIRHRIVLIPYTKINLNVLKVFKKEGYIQDITIENERELLVTLRYKGWWIKKPLFSNLKRISKPGLRIYANHKEIPRILNGAGIILLSTPVGILTDREARSRAIGGELLCSIW